MDDPLLFSFFAYLPFFSLFSRTGYGQRVDNGRGHWATPTSRPLRSWTATLLGWRAGWSCDIVQFVPFRNVLQQTQSIFSPHQEGSTTMSGNVNSTMARLQLAKRGAGRSARTVSQLHESQSYCSQSRQQRCRRSQTPLLLLLTYTYSDSENNCALTFFLLHFSNKIAKGSGLEKKPCIQSPVLINQIKIV